MDNAKDSWTTPEDGWTTPKSGPRDLMEILFQFKFLSKIQFLLYGEKLQLPELPSGLKKNELSDTYYQKSIHCLEQKLKAEQLI